MSQVDLLSRLLPSIPDLDDMLNRIREKHVLPEALPENEQLAEILVSNDFFDWSAIRQEIENELRA